MGRVDSALLKGKGLLLEGRGGFASLRELPSFTPLKMSYLLKRRCPRHLWKRLMNPGGFKAAPSLAQQRWRWGCSRSTFLKGKSGLMEGCGWPFGRGALYWIRWVWTLPEQDAQPLKGTRGFLG
uniref:Uncharacterized protein n=1 Tax=Molossus molossus TaxID=27622 RepID=A0A7J8C8K0_MOLMO|nr:hypothetical protein HJG59_009853 [Molossus molossus]